MILDSSVLVAIAIGEASAADLVQKIRGADFAGIGAPTLTEAGIVIDRKLGGDTAGLLERLVDEFAIQELPFGEAHWREALSAFRRFGKGRHPARLNFGDCLTYATASLSGEPLLYVGDDFALTDLERA